MTNLLQDQFGHTSRKPTSRERLHYSLQQNHNERKYAGKLFIQAYEVMSRPLKESIKKLNELADYYESKSHGK